MNAESHVADDVGQKILEKIKTHAPEDASNITLDTPLADLGIHSLELTEIIFDVEDEFDIEVEMNTAEAWENLSTVNDIVAAVRELVEAKS
ncbi:acyl carrier protein [Nitratireductor indicus]|uniref:NodF n=1 Tax=Nitratireductor indicus C115 TaxID=1231190 RepID=K2NQY0_9HYPH|nr:acyl carrier protein [Nitratireductor indicus]EKF41795.1 NodF [Nitratireductor indicus C115]MDS1136924.1 acyl carrier protein [Nitratireductor indicus]SFQ67260.1 nodulation protein F [Nitratireductor indicus]